MYFNIRAFNHRLLDHTVSYLEYSYIDKQISISEVNFILEKTSSSHSKLDDYQEIIPTIAEVRSLFLPFERQVRDRLFFERVLLCHRPG